MDADEFEEFLDSLATAVQLPQAPRSESSEAQVITLPQDEPQAGASEEPREQEEASSEQPPPPAVPGKDLPVCDEKTILANPRQKDNPLVKHLSKQVVVEYTEDIKADFVFGRGQCGVFLSLKYHNLYPNYIYDKIRSISSGYPLKATLMACWTFEEAARYVESYKLYRYKSPEMLMPKQLANNKGTEGSYECVAEALSSVKRITRTDAVSLISTFGSLEKIARTSVDGLSVVPGLGPQKAEHLNRLFRRPFMRT